MSSFESFKDIHSWQNARVLVRQIHVICRRLDAQREFALRDQLFRAALSIMNNIAEGFGRFSNPDFLRFLSIARASAYEVESMLAVIEDLQLVDTADLVKANRQLSDTVAPLSGLMAYLRSNEGRKPFSRPLDNSGPLTPNSEHRTQNTKL